MLQLYPSKNRSLARLATMKRDKWLEIKTPMLPKTLRQELDYFYKTIAGYSMADDLTTLLVAFDKDTKTYLRIYPPSIYSNVDGDLVIVWGNNFYPLTSEILNYLDAQVSLEELEKYTETVLVLSLEVNDELLELPVQLRFNNESRDIKMSDLKKLLKNIRAGKSDPKNLASLLYIREVREQKEFKPTFALKDLVEDSVYTVISSELKDFGTHQNYILTCKDAEGEEVQCYAPSVIRDSLDAGASIDSGVTSFSYVVRQGKKRPQYIVSVESLLWPEDDDEMIQISQ